MTENLLAKLEEKIMLFLSEIEELRGKLDRVIEENANLKLDRDHFERKIETRLKDLITLFETVTEEKTTVAPASNLATLKPVFVENLKENIS